ncbi:MAG: LysR substrate-binding domain-containing protein, partial [Myxococcota bacterium]
MRFDLIDLRLFVDIHDAGSITGGAQRSHMTLASASERIRGLEDALGVALLRREPRGVTPTAAGRTLLQHARSVLQQIERLRGDLGEFADGLSGHIRLYCNTAALSEYLPPLLARFLAQYPRLSVDIEERASRVIADAVRDGLCDLGAVSDAANLAGLETWAFRDDPLVLVVPRDDVLATRRPVRFAELLDREFVGLAEGSALHEHLAEQARGLGARLRYRVRLRGFDAVCALVGQGVGIAIVSAAAARRHARGAGIVRVALAE